MTCPSPALIHLSPSKQLSFSVGAAHTRRSRVIAACARFNEASIGRSFGSIIRGAPHGGHARAMLARHRLYQRLVHLHIQAGSRLAKKCPGTGSKRYFISWNGEPAASGVCSGRSCARSVQAERGEKRV